MARDTDPYRLLGLTREASLAEVKQAYRRLAKANHPDAAGEAALPRFLAIQAAYDQIVGSGASGTPGGRPTPPRRPWDADPDRADATRRAYGGRARRARTGSARQTDGASASAGGPGTPSGGKRPARPPNKATLGSTSYDGTEGEPFEPDWGGASWYGTTSGTYWTLNPKEYADPRKHGPEYQARARRAAAAARRADPTASADDAGATRDPADHPGADVAAADDRNRDPASGEAPEAAAAAAAAAPDRGSPPPTHTTASWWDATAGPPAVPHEGTTSAPRDATIEPRDRPSDAATERPPRSDPQSHGWRWLEGDHPGWAARIGRAVIGWVPITAALAWLAGELSGCARLSADCDPPTSWLVWVAQVGVLAGLILLPRLASLAAIAAIAACVGAVPTVLVLSMPQEGEVSTGTMGVAAGLIAVVWAAGLAVAVSRAVRGGPRPVS